MLKKCRSKLVSLDAVLHPHLHISLSYTSKKDRLRNGLYHSPRLQEIVVLVTAAKMMAPNAVPKQNQNMNIPMAYSSS
jgi:hypothetical protein